MTTTRRLLFPILMVGVLVASPLMAQTAPKSDAARVEQVESGGYAVEPDHTQIGFGVSHLGFSNFRGRFGDASGTLRLDAGNPSNSSFDVQVPTASVNTAVDKLTGELKSADWLDAKAFPQIRFKASHVEPTGPREANVTGELTLHGVTKPVTLVAKLHGAGVNPLNKKVTVGFDLAGTIRRSDFGVKTYLPLIGDEVVLEISAAFEKQG